MTGASRRLALALATAGSLLACAGPTPSPTPTPARSMTPAPSASAPLSPSVAPSPTPLDASSLTGRIVFDHEFDIWVMNADGSERQRLTDDTEADFDAAWSPDGGQIAFRSHRDGNEEVYVMRGDGSNERNLTNNPTSDYSPAWSPDGTQIAFASDRGPGSGGNDIWVVNTDGTDLRRLTVGGGIDEYPSWSPDGSQIAYACSGGRILPEGTADFELCVMDADGSNQHQITDAEGLSDHPAWSPDGQHIAFMSTRGGWPTLPDYVPPGYEAGEFGEHDVYLAAVDGSDVVNVTNNGRQSEEFPGWSPDGDFLIFSRYGCLVVTTPDGAAELQLTTSALCADGFPNWN